MSELPAKKPANEDVIDLRELIRTLWAGKLTIAFCILIVAAIATSYTLLATEIFRSEASVQIRDENSTGLSSELGGLAALAGISVGAQDHKREFALSALTSRAVIQRMIEEEELLPILYADEWDAENMRWRTTNSPTPWKAYEEFTNNVLNVSVDRNSGIVTVAIEWEDPALSAAWVKSLIGRVNAFVNEATIREAEQNLEFLDQQAQTTSVVELEKTIFSMMEGEISRLMIARNPETAPLRIIDPAVASERPVHPRRVMIVLLGILSGALLGGLIVLARSAMSA